MNKLKLLVTRVPLLLITVVCVCSKINAQSREQLWREDIMTFVDTIQSKQINFDKHIDLNAFGNTINRLLDSLEVYSDGQIEYTLQTLISKLRISHSQIGLNSSFSIPIGFELFDDGLFIVATSEPYTEYIGQKVLAINSVPIREIFAKSREIYSYENDNWLQVKFTQNINSVSFLQFIGVENVQDSIMLLTKDKGEFNVFTSQESKQMIPDEDITKLLLFNTKGKNYWLDTLTSSVMYVQYSRCREDPNQSISEFAQEFRMAMRNYKIEKVVFDLRYNGGGNSRIIRNLIKEIKKSVPEKIYVLTSKRTFSSGVLSAMYLKDSLEGSIVGNETGGSPNSYGEVKSFQLPNSKLTVDYTTAYISHGYPTWGTLYPDVIIPYLSQYYLQGIDPILEYILND